MKTRYFKQLASSLFGLVLFGLLLFLPAGTFDYWQAWVFIAIFAVVIDRAHHLPASTNPAVLEGRMHAGPAAETRTAAEIRQLCPVAGHSSADGVQRSRPSLWLVAMSDGGRSCSAMFWWPWTWHRRLRDPTEQLCGCQYHGRSGPESDIHRALWTGAASDVLRIADHHGGHPALRSTPIGDFSASSRRDRRSPSASSTKKRCLKMNSTDTSTTPGKCSTGWCRSSGDGQAGGKERKRKT